jgi:ATP-dependent DNA ligase
MFIIFDLLGKDRQSYVKRSLQERRAMLEEFARENFKTKSMLRLSPATTNLATAKKWFAKVGGNLDGVIAKDLNASYASGERTAAIKVKQIRSADCVVGGFRYASGARVIGSLLLGLYGEDGLLHHVGFTSSFKASDRRALTKKFEALKKPPGFTGNAQVGRVVGARIALVNGNRSIPKSWSKLPMIILPAGDFGTAQGSCDGGRTKRLVNARWNRWNIAKANRLPSCNGRMRQQTAGTPSP